MQKITFVSACFVFFLTLSFPLLSLAEPITPSVPSQGIVVGMRHGSLFVQKVYHGSAGDQAGLRVGDIILAIGNTTVAGMTPRDVGYVLDFNPGSTVAVTIVRNNVTQFVYLTKDYPVLQWQLAWNQNQSEFAGKQPVPPSQKGGKGELIYAPGQISYATSNSEMDSMGYSDHAESPAMPAMQGESSGAITYEMLYGELMQARQQLGALAQSIDRLANKVESVRPSENTPIVERYTPSFVREGNPYKTQQRLRLPSPPMPALEPSTEVDDATILDELPPEVREIIDSQPQESKSYTTVSDEDINAEIEAIFNPKSSENQVQDVPATSDEDIISEWEKNKNNN